MRVRPRVGTTFAPGMVAQRELELFATCGAGAGSRPSVVCMSVLMSTFLSAGARYLLSWDTISLRLSKTPPAVMVPSTTTPIRSRNNCGGTPLETTWTRAVPSVTSNSRFDTLSNGFPRSGGDLSAEPHRGADGLVSGSAKLLRSPVVDEVVADPAHGDAEERSAGDEKCREREPLRPPTLEPGHVRSSRAARFFSAR